MKKESHSSFIFCILSVVSFIILHGNICSAQTADKNYFYNNATIDTIKKNIIESLGLSDDKKAQLKEISDYKNLILKEQTKSLQNYGEQLNAELNNYRSNTDKINNLENKILDIHKKILDINIKSILDAKKILSQEKFKKFQEKVSKMF